MDDYGDALMLPSSHAQSVLDRMTTEERFNLTDLLKRLQGWYGTDSEGREVRFHPEMRGVLWGMALAKLADHFRGAGNNKRALFFMESAWNVCRYPVFAWNAALLAIELQESTILERFLHSYLAEYPTALSNQLFTLIDPELSREKLDDYAASARAILSSLGPTSGQASAERSDLTTAALALHRELDSYIEFLSNIEMVRSSQEEFHSKLSVTLSAIRVAVESCDPRLGPLSIAPLLKNGMSAFAPLYESAGQAVDRFSSAMVSLLKGEHQHLEQVRSGVGELANKIQLVEATGTIRQVALAMVLGKQAERYLEDVPAYEKITLNVTDRVVRQLRRERKFSDIRLLLGDATHRMPQSWKPIRESAGFVERAFWDISEYLAFGARYQDQRDRIKWTPGSYSKAWFQLADVAVEEEQLDSALRYVDLGLELEADHPELWNLKGLILNRTKQHEEALTCYRRAAMVREWAPEWQVARAYRGQGATLIDLGRLDEAEAAFLLSQELEPDNDVAKKELDFIRKTQATARIQNSGSTLRFQESPYDPLTIKLRSEVENLEPIPGPKTVGPENYSRILKAFMEHGWPGFEEMFDQIVPQTRPDYVKVKRDLLREPAFGLGTQQNAARLAEVWATESDPEKRKAAIKAAIEKIQRNSRKS